VDVDERMARYLSDVSEPEDTALRNARVRSEQHRIAAVPPVTGAAIRFFMRLLRARHVVEVGTGAGYSGLWLLGGMEPRGTLTTIEVEAANQGLAQQSFSEARVGDRVRSMLGPALSVLPKLADDHYDAVWIDAAKSEYPHYLAHAKRLLRPDGLLLADNLLWSGRVADLQRTDEDTAGLRLYSEMVAEDPELHGALLPVGDGLGAAVYRPEDAGR
jgi:predicted O-methyltransferase YrrM